MQHFLNRPARPSRYPWFNQQLKGACFVQAIKVPSQNTTSFPMHSQPWSAAPRRGELKSRLQFWSQNHRKEFFTMERYWVGGAKQIGASLQSCRKQSHRIRIVCFCVICYFRHDLEKKRNLPTCFLKKGWLIKQVKPWCRGSSPSARLCSVPAGEPDLMGEM